MGKLIAGKDIAAKILAEVAAQVNLLKQKNITPKLAVIFVGDNPASAIYVKKKAKAAKQVNIDFDLHKFPASIKTTDLIAKIDKIQADPSLTGLIIQLPLPNTLPTDEILNTIKPDIDVDCLTSINQNKLANNNSPFLPPTPQAVLTILKELKIDLKNKHINIIGRGRLVGKPLAIMLQNSGAYVTVCHSQTTDLQTKCLAADIIISATGKGGLLTSQMVKDQVIIIDAGSNLVKNKLQGDIDFKALQHKVAYITPTPGGVGPVTIAQLFANTVLSAKKIDL